MPVAVTVGEDGALHWTGPAIIAGDLWQRPNVELRTGTLARRVVLDGDRATGVEVVDVATGERSTITARAVVVAADAFRTPQLLWASGIRPEALGRYLTEHPQIMAASVLDEKYVPADAPVDAALPVTAAAAPGGGAIVPVSGVSWVPYAADRPFHGQVMQMDASPVPLDPGVTVRPGQVVGLGWFCKKELSPDNRVWFDDDATDEHGLPAIRIDYALSAADEAAIAAAKVEIAEAAAGAGPTARRAVRHAARQLAALPRDHPDGHRGRRHQRLRPDRPGLGHRQPLRRRQQRRPDRHRLQSDRDRGRARRPHRPHPGRLPGQPPRRPRSARMTPRVLIVGSGPTGATYARRLLERPATTSPC